jgi:hypothetical protein
MVYNTKEHDDALTKKLYGSWEMCKISDFNIKTHNISAIVRNVCPEISFEPDHKGHIKMGDKVVSAFRWSVINGKFLLGTFDKDSSIPKGEYDVTFNDQLLKVIFSTQSGLVKVSYELYKIRSKKCGLKHY